MSESSAPFSSRVADGMRLRGVTLRSLCRSAGLDPSFFSKVLSGKRSPPADEAVLRRIAGTLELDPAELIVSAGRIPAEWHALWEDPGLFRDIHALASRSGRWERQSRSPGPAKAGKHAAPSAVPPRRELAEELL